MAIREIRVFPDPILRRKAKPVKEVDREIKALVQDMIETMHAAPGVGLAAPQVGISRRVIVADPSAGEDPQAVLALINPVVVSSEGKAVAEEGCLSLPDVQEEVERPERVTVEGLFVDGRKACIEADGLLARILQHEIDHVDGILILDRIGPLKRDLIKRKLRKRQRVEA
ncbi:MAG: peptide deformylase [Candidatus Tectomicrobia bacterium]|nr:peptide deformylase [Candidatus Tectomicrobia bacterium]